MLRAYSGRSHGGFRGTALLFRAVRLSLSAGHGLWSACLQRYIRGHSEGQGFPLSGKATGESRYFSALQVQSAAVGFLVHLLPFPGATVQRFSLGICQRHGNFLLVSRLFIPGRREQIPTKVPTKMASSMCCRGSRRFMTDERKRKKKVPADVYRLRGTSMDFWGRAGPCQSVPWLPPVVPFPIVPSGNIGMYH